MERLYELVVFDWEGTLGDPLGYLLNAIDEQASFWGLEPLERSQVRRYVPEGLELALKKIFPNLSTLQYVQLLEDIQRISQLHTKEQCLFEGAKALVSSIQSAGMHLAVATNKGAQSLQKALHATGMDQFFSVTRSAGQVPAKPCPQMLEEIMDIFSIDANRTLMIGDSVSDVEMAVALNVECLGIDFYGHQKDALKAAGAVCVFENYTQISHFLGLT